MNGKVLIDGREGTTGLQIAELLAQRSDLTVLSIRDADRKRSEVKVEVFREADVVILCLPDESARAAVELAAATRLIDASTAHRTAAGWTYGLPELAPELRKSISSASRVANPGCYPTGFLLTIRPLLDAEVLSPKQLVRTHAVSGYSGGGKKLIAKYDAANGSLLDTRPYGLTLKHKHVPEMRVHSGLHQNPLFMPAVGPFYRGMLVQTAFHRSDWSVRVTKQGLVDLYKERYLNEPFVRVLHDEDEDTLQDGFLSAVACNGTNRVDIGVFGHDEHLLVVARLDNLGKGASMAAVQNLNLMLGLPETKGLPVE